MWSSALYKTDVPEPPGGLILWGFMEYTIRLVFHPIPQYN